MTNLAPPGQLNFSASNVAEVWCSWEAVFENYFVAANFNNQSKDVQVATLLHCAGPTATDIFATFTFHGDDEKDNYKHLLRKFSAYCEPKQNELFETYRLLHRQHVPGEPLESWIKDLRVIRKDATMLISLQMIVC